MKHAPGPLTPFPIMAKVGAKGKRVVQPPTGLRNRNKVSANVARVAEKRRRCVRDGGKVILRWGIFFICFLAFIANSYQNMKKFMDGESTVTQSWEWSKNKLLLLPTMTICPEAPLSDNHGSKYNHHLQIGDLIKCEVTDDSKDCLQNVYHLEAFADPLQVNFSNHRVMYSRNRGKCFTVSLPLEVNSSHALAITLTNIPSIIHFHEPDEEFFIACSWNLFDMPTLIKSRDVIRFDMVTVTRSSLRTEENCRDWHASDQRECLKAQLLLEKSKFGLNCTATFLESLLYPYSFADELCQQAEDIYEISRLIDISISHSLATTCPEPCSHVKYTLSQQSFSFGITHPNDTEKKREIILWYSLAATKVFKPVLLSSLGDFISSVGGNLGLFFDFSLVSILLGLLNYYYVLKENQQ